MQLRIVLAAPLCPVQISVAELGALAGAFFSAEFCTSTVSFGIQATYCSVESGMEGRLDSEDCNPPPQRRFCMLEQCESPAVAGRESWPITPLELASSSFQTQQPTAGTSCSPWHRSPHRISSHESRGSSTRQVIYFHIPALYPISLSHASRQSNIAKYLGSDMC